jgi:hypothetical protein
MAKSVAKKIISAKKKKATPARKTHEKHVFEGSGATCKVRNTKALTVRSKYEIHAGENKVGCGAHHPPADAPVELLSKSLPLSV